MGMPGAMYIGHDAIMAAYDDMADSPYYSVWLNTSTPWITWLNEDKIRGRQLLSDTLTAGEQNDNKTILYIKIHPVEKTLKYVKPSSPVLCTLVCQCVKGEVPAAASSGNSALEIYKLEQLVSSMKTSFDTKMAEIEIKLAAEPEDEYEEPADTIGRIQTILEHPLVRKLSEIPEIMGLIQKVIGFIGNSIPSTVQPNNLLKVAGTPPDSNPQGGNQQPEVQELDMQKLTADLQRLTPYCNLNETIAKLADLAEQKTGVFNMALTQLNTL